MVMVSLVMQGCIVELIPYSPLLTFWARLLTLLALDRPPPPVVPGRPPPPNLWGNLLGSVSLLGLRRAPFAKV